MQNNCVVITHFVVCVVQLVDWTEVNKANNDLESFNVRFD